MSTRVLPDTSPVPAPFAHGGMGDERLGALLMFGTALFLSGFMLLRDGPRGTLFVIALAHIGGAVVFLVLLGHIGWQLRRHKRVVVPPLAN